MVSLSAHPRLTRVAAVFLGLACGYFLLIPQLDISVRWVEPLIVLVGRAVERWPEAFADAVLFGAISSILSLPKTLLIGALAALFVRRFGCLRHVSYAVMAWGMFVHGFYRFAIWYVRSVAEGAGMNPDLLAFNFEYRLPVLSVDILLTYSTFLVLLYLFSKQKYGDEKMRPEPGPGVAIPD